MSVILPDKPLIDTLPTPAAVRERLHQCLLRQRLLLSDRARAIMPRLAEIAGGLNVETELGK